MMPLYTMSSLRGMHFQGVPPRGVSANMYREAPPPGSEDNSDEESEGGYDSVHSVPSPTDELFLDQLHAARGELSEDYGEFLQDALAAHQEAGVTSDSDGEAPSGASSHSRLATPPSNMASRLMDIGLFDLEFSEPPDFLGEEHTDDSHETDSDGELSNLNSGEDDDEPDEDYDEVPNPPQLPSVSEERLQEVWPLGDQSFSIFLCPITHDVMTDPVVSADGYTYERAAIARWFETSRKSPVTGQTLPHTDLVANHSVRTLLKMLIDMTESSLKAPGALPALASSSAANLASAAHTASASAAGSARAEQQRQSRRSSTASASQGGVAASGDSLPPPPPMLAADRQREQTDPSGDSEFSSRRDGDVRHMEAATMAAATAALQSSSSTAAPGRRQQRAQTAQVLFSSTPSSPTPGQPATSSGNVQLSRPSSQPQPQSQSSTGSSGQQRPQSSAGCQQQQRPQAPSTALPPLRPGHTPPRSSQTPPMPPAQEPSGSRGASPPLMVPPLSYRSGPHMGRLPGQPPIPTPHVPSEGGTSSQSSNNSASSQRHEAESPFTRLDRGHKQSNSITGAEHA